MQSSGHPDDQSYDLTKLFDYVGTDPEVVKDMVGIFIRATTESLVCMEACLSAADFVSLSKESHKIKTSLQIFGFDDQLETIHVFEQAKGALPHDAQERFGRLKQRLLHGIQALKEDFGMKD